MVIFGLSYQELTRTVRHVPFSRKNTKSPRGATIANKKASKKERRIKRRRRRANRAFRKGFGLTYKQLTERMHHTSFQSQLPPKTSIVVSTSSNVDQSIDLMRPLKAASPAWPPTLYKHQELGVKWLLKREHSAQFPGGLLCDEPGMGKTIQMGACMSQNPVKNTLLILPNAVIVQWSDTLGKMLPQAAIHIHHGLTKITDASILDKASMNVIIVTIAGITNPKFNKKKKNKKKIKKRAIIRTFGLQVFEGITWDRIIMDECHYIKNKSSTRSKSACDLKGCIRWGLTGTPVQNSINDLITLFMFIKPVAWDVSKKPIKPSTIHFYKRRLLLRRTKDKHPVDPNHPIKISNINETSVTFPFATTAERQLYKKTLEHIDTQMTLAEKSDISNIGKYQCMLELLLRARQLSIHPHVYLDGIKRRATRLNTEYVAATNEEGDYDFTTLSSRYEAVLKCIEAKPNTNQLLFCRYTEEMKLWEKVLTERSIKCRMYNGSTSMTEREENINCFTLDNPGGVLLIQIMAGGVGLNLQQFTRVLLTTPDWNPSNEIQAIARSHRIGQMLPVEIFRFILDDPEYENTIDKRIVAVQTVKRAIMADLLEDESLYTENRLTLPEIREIVCGDAMHKTLKRRAAASNRKVAAAHMKSIQSQPTTIV